VKVDRLGAALVTRHEDPAAGWAQKVPVGGLALAVCTATAILGLLRLGAKGLWHDEAFSEAMARLDLPTLWAAITRAESFNGLYYLLLHLWVRVDDSETWLRLPSVIFGVLAAYALFALTRRLFGPRTATIAAVLFAVNAFFVRYEQEARAYSLVLFGVIAATYLFVAAVDHQRSTPRWLGYAVVSAIAVYAHVFAAYVIAAHMVVLPLRRTRPRFRDAVVAYGLFALLVAPLALVLAKTDDLQRRFIERPTLHSIEVLLLNLTGAGGVASRGGRMLLLAYFLACCAALVMMARRMARLHQYRSDAAWPHVLVLAWLVVPLLGSFLTSMVQPMFLPRYLIVALPALPVLAAVGISGLPTRPVRMLAVGVLVGLTIPGLLSYYRADYKEREDWRRAAAYVLAGHQARDQVVFFSRYGRRPFEYYSRNDPRQAALLPLYPSVTWGSYTPVLDDLELEPTGPVVERLREGRRVWVVLLWAGFGSEHEGGRAVEAALRRRYRELERRQFGSVLQVRLYEAAHAG
jgi:4-amino-4-deoxy-L-arabinose transferase-like glycosyltransferase